MTLTLQKRGRDRISIMAEILGIGLEGVVKTNIMYRANLSFLQVNNWLDFLLDLRLIEVIKTKGSTIYKTTPKGVMFLQTYENLRDVLKVQTYERSKPQVKEDVMNKDRFLFSAINSALDELKQDVASLDRRIGILERRIAQEGKCPACGREIMSDFRLCPYCGESLMIPVGKESTKKEMK